MQTGVTTLQLLFSVLAEGGGLYVFGCERDGAWRFRLDLDQRTFASFDDTLDPSELFSQSGWLTWEEVLVELDRDGCWRLYPRNVHPLVAARLDEAVDARALDREDARRWKKEILRSRTARRAQPRR